MSAEESPEDEQSEVAVIAGLVLSILCSVAAVVALQLATAQVAYERGYRAGWSAASGHEQQGLPQAKPRGE